LSSEVCIAGRAWFSGIFGIPKIGKYVTSKTEKRILMYQLRGGKAVGKNG